MVNKTQIQLDFSFLLNEIKGIIHEEVRSALKLKDATETKAEVLTREQTCQLLNVSKTTLHNWHQQSLLIPSKIGGRVYYSKQDVLNKLSA